MYSFNVLFNATVSCQPKKVLNKYLCLVNHFNLVIFPCSDLEICTESRMERLVDLNCNLHRFLGKWQLQFGELYSIPIILVYKLTEEIFVSYSLEEDNRSRLNNLFGSASGGVARARNHGRTLLANQFHVFTSRDEIVRWRHNQKEGRLRKVCRSKPSDESRDIKKGNCTSPHFLSL